MADRVIEKYRAWEKQDNARWLLWGALGMGLMAASAAVGFASLVGVALFAGAIIAGVKSAGALTWANAARQSMDDRETLRAMSTQGVSAALPSRASETVSPQPATPEPEAAKSWTAAVTEKPTLDAAHAGRGV